MIGWCPRSHCAPAVRREGTRLVRVTTKDRTPMSAPPPESLSELVALADTGDSRARERLFTTLYEELHRLARREVRRQGASSPLSATTLLHEAYLAVAGTNNAALFPTEGHFLAYAAKAMRGVLIDRVRNQQAQRRGGGIRATTLDGDTPGQDADPDELIAIHDALHTLEGIDADLAHVVDLHFFCGFSLAEIGALQGVSDRTVQRKWVKARVLLRQMLDTSVP
jgi:RNA polymerase sigma factor (TIGR02999 family)